MASTVTYYVYIVANKRNGTLYVGVTNDLVRLVYQHKNNEHEGFTKPYGVHRLVWDESTTDIHAALMRDKQMKKWKRQRKKRLIEEKNPDWDDKYEGMCPVSDGFLPCAGMTRGGWDDPCEGMCPVSDGFPTAQE